MKKIIVTGGAGFIGSNLIRYLINKNYFVVNIDKGSYSSNRYNLHGLSKTKHKYYKIDIGSSKIQKILSKYKPSIIFNLAAETHVDRSIDSPKEFINSNINGVFNLLECIKKFNKINKKKIKLIHISTDEVYGDIKNLSLRADEKFAYNPSSPYAATKASSDHLVKSYAKTYKIPTIITNCSNNYGPRQYPEKLIPKIIYNILNNLPLPIYGKGKNSREWIYVNDHCKALELIGKKGKVGENYNIGSGKNISNIKLTEIIIKILKEKIKIGKNVKIKFVKDRPGHDFRYAINSKKIYKNLKWKSETKLEDGLKKTIYWYLNNLRYFKFINKKNFINRLGLKI